MLRFSELRNKTKALMAKSLGPSLVFASCAWSLNLTMKTQKRRRRRTTVMVMFACWHLGCQLRLLDGPTRSKPPKRVAKGGKHIQSLRCLLMTVKHEFACPKTLTLHDSDLHN